MISPWQRTRGIREESWVFSRDPPTLQRPAGSEAIRAAPAAFLPGRQAGLTLWAAAEGGLQAPLGACIRTWSSGTQEQRQTPVSPSLAPQPALTAALLHTPELAL